MSQFLQNHPGKPKFPFHPKFGKIYIRQMNKSIKWLFWLGIFLTPITGVSFIFSLFLWRWQAAQPAREQKRYYKDSGLDWLPIEKRQALQLYAPAAYFEYIWTETLEMEPCLERYKDKQVPKFEYLSLSKQTDFIGGLERSWGVISNRNFEDTVKTLFEGLHSQRFLYAMKFVDKNEIDKLVLRLSDLTHFTEEKIKQSLHSQDNRPSTLLWGFDLWRIIPLTRKAYCAGLISEQRAWEILLKVSDWVHAMFPNLDSFYDSYRLGNAYWSDDVETCLERRQWVEKYHAQCDWPIKSVPWPENVKVEFPRYVWDSFAQEMDDIRKAEFADVEHLII